MIGRCPVLRCRPESNSSTRRSANAGDPTLLLVCGYTSQLNGWDAGLCERFVDAGAPRRALRQPRRRALEQADRQPCSPRKVLAGDPRRRTGARGPVHAVRHGGRRHRPARPSRRRTCAHRRHVDGRDDRPDDGDRASGPDRQPHLDHVEHRATRGRAPRRPRRARRCWPHRRPTGRPTSRHRPEREVWASKRYVDHDAMKARAAADFDRTFYPEGAPRQLAAIYATGDRSRSPAGPRRADARDPRARRHADHTVGRRGHRAS